jgi:hypothetical protein
MMEGVPLKDLKSIKKNEELSDWIVQYERWPSAQSDKPDEARLAAWISYHGGRAAVFSVRLFELAQECIRNKKKMPREEDIKEALLTLKKSEPSYLLVTELLRHFSKYHPGPFRDYFSSCPEMKEYFEKLEWDHFHGHVITFVVP